MEQPQGAIMPDRPDFRGGMEYCPEGYPGPQCEIGLQGPQSCPCPYCEAGCRASRWWLEDPEASKARILEWLHKYHPWIFEPLPTGLGRPRCIIPTEESSIATHVIYKDK